MDSFLQELESHGRVDSAGVFTIDSRRARLKLAEFQLASFNLYVDFLVSAAIAAGARSLDLTVRPHGRLSTGVLSTFYFRGWALEIDDLEALRPEKSQSLGKRSLGHLGVALSTLSARYVVLLRSRGSGEDTLSVRIHEGSMETRLMADPKHPKETTTLRLAVDVTKDATESFERFRIWSPVRLSFNQALIGTGPSACLDFSKVAAVLIGPGCPQALQDFEVDESRMYFDSGEGLEENSFLLALTDPESAQSAGLVFLYDGKTYPIFEQFNEIGVCGYLSAVDLRRDLSFTGLLDTKEYQEKAGRLLRLVGRLVLLSLRSGRTFTQHEQLSFHLLLNLLDDYLETSAHWQALDQTSAELEPTLDDITFKLQLQQLARNSEQGERLLQAYQKCLEAVRGRGLAGKAIAYLRHKIDVSKALGRVSRIDTLQKYLFSLLGGRNSRPEFGEYTELQLYLESLYGWEKGQSPGPTENFRAGVHRSWYLPFALHYGIYFSDWDKLAGLEMEPLPAWVDFLKLVFQNKHADALAILKANRSLAFDEARALWYRYLWFYWRGQISFALAVTFRAGLSIAEIRRSDHDPLNWTVTDWGEFLLPKSQLQKHETLEKLRSHCVEQAYFSKEFWPFLCVAITESSRKGSSSAKGFWVQLCAQSLLHAVYEAGPERALTLPFLAEQPV